MTRKLLTVLLLSLALCGTQVVKASPLHDHASHFSGCSLCHFDGAQALHTASPAHEPLPESGKECTRAISLALFAPTYPAFHGRAPPGLSL